MTLTGGYGATPDRNDAIALLRGAVEQGVTFFDTTEIYGPHVKQELVGEALAPFDGQVVIQGGRYLDHLEAQTNR